MNSASEFFDTKHVVNSCLAEREKKLFTISDMFSTKVKIVLIHYSKFKIVSALNNLKMH